MPDARDLCTLAGVRTLMQKITADTAQDALIATLITRASVKIMRDYGREFVPGGPASLSFTAATRLFEYPWAEQYPGEAFLSLAPYDLQLTPVPTITVDTDQASPIVLTTDEYRLWPIPASQNVYMAVKLQPIGATSGLLGWRKRQISITGNWGFPSVPPEVAQATEELVIHWISANPAMRRAPDEDMMQILPRSYPMTAVDLLGTFKRMTV